MASEVKTNNISPATGTSVTFSGLNVGSDARGDILYHDGTDYTRLAKPGTPADELLTFATGASDPAWVAAAGGGGKIGQVLQETKTDTFTTDATTWIDIPDLSVDITPAATSSKILVMMCIVGNGKPAASGAALRIVRDSTAIALGDAASNRLRSTSHIYTGEYYGVQAGVMTWLDEPGLDVAITYKIQGFCSNPTNTMHINRFTTDTDATDIPRTVSTITVMEVLA